MQNADVGSLLGRLARSCELPTRGALLAALTAMALGAGAEPASAFLFYRDDGVTFGGGPPPGIPEAVPPRRKPSMPKRARPLTPAEQGRHDEVLAKAKGRLLQAIISLDGQSLVLYADGEEIARSPVSTGTRSHPTPTGIFSVLEKQRYHRSNIYSNAPMPYMQRITWSGVALHQGVLPGYPASHGCIRMPESFARLMWSATRNGARVVIARPAVAPYLFTHARLFTLKPKPIEVPPAASPQAAGSHAAVEGMRLAEAGAPTTDAPPAAGDASVPRPAGSSHPALAPAQPAVPTAPEAKPLKPGPITVFISRKEQKLFVRKGFEPVFDAPVTIDNPAEPIGTHLFTALPVAGDETALRWIALTMPPKAAQPVAPVSKGRRPASRATPVSAAPAASSPSPAAALDRITIPPETLTRVTELMSAGASFIVSDYGLGPETGKGTDFIVVTR